MAEAAAAALRSLAELRDLCYDVTAALRNL